MKNETSSNGAPHEREILEINQRDSRPVLITGGAGFIGTNLAHQFCGAGQRVLLFDNLSRPGAERNLEWLQQTHPDLIEIEVADVRNESALRKVVKDVSRVFHFAAQVAVTTSLENPIDDFETNARGTLNLLEALRALNVPPPLFYTSSNKVYGDLADVKISCDGQRYSPEDPVLRKNGFSEARPLNFHSPYGCSKGAAGQYILDYARTFKLPTIVFHMSCIYGLHQFGNEDQGWVAHFLIRAIEENPITIYGDGKQVRDILFVDDLINAFLLAQKNIERLAGQSFNIGGGPANTISLIELLGLIRELHGAAPRTRFEQWRSADQQYYVSDIRKFFAATGWTPKTGVSEGVRRLYEWLVEEREASTETVRIDSTEFIPEEDRQLLLHEAEPRSKRLRRESTGGAILSSR